MIALCSRSWHVPAARIYVTAALPIGGRVSVAVSDRGSGRELARRGEALGSGLVIVGECPPLTGVWGPLWWTDTQEEWLVMIERFRN